MLHLVKGMAPRWSATWGSWRRHGNQGTRSSAQWNWNLGIVLLDKNVVWWVSQLKRYLQPGEMKLRQKFITWKTRRNSFPLCESLLKCLLSLGSCRGLLLALQLKGKTVIGLDSLSEQMKAVWTCCVTSASSQPGRKGEINSLWFLGHRACLLSSGEV